MLVGKERELCGPTMSLVTEAYTTPRQTHIMQLLQLYTSSLPWQSFTRDSMVANKCSCAVPIMSRSVTTWRQGKKRKCSAGPSNEVVSFPQTMDQDQRHNDNKCDSHNQSHCMTCREKVLAFATVLLPLGPRTPRQSRVCSRHLVVTRRSPGVRRAMNDA